MQKHGDMHEVVLDLKVVMDTNVFVSGVFFSGPPYQILKAWQLGEFELIVSREILDENRRVGEILGEEHPGVDLKPILNFVLEHAKVYKSAGQTFVENLRVSGNSSFEAARLCRSVFGVMQGYLKAPTPLR